MRNQDPSVTSVCIVKALDETWNNEHWVCFQLLSDGCFRFLPSQSNSKEVISEEKYDGVENRENPRKKMKQNKDELAGRCTRGWKLIGGWGSTAVCLPNFRSLGFDLHHWEKEKERKHKKENHSRQNFPLERKKSLYKHCNERFYY